MKLAALVIAIAAATTGAQAGTGMDLYNQCGNGLKAGLLHRNGCHGFIVGVASGLVQSHAICFSGTLGAEQATMIVQAYMRAHPEQLGEDAGAVVSAALVSAYPCQ